MSKLKTITLHAARSKAFPEGSIRHGYTFVAPLDGEGRIDAEAWKAHRGECFVHRFWADEPDTRGLLAHRSGGRGGASWAFELEGYDGEDEAFRFADHAFREGEYVSVRDEDGEPVTLRVVSVR